jgi:acetyl-CoA C-acetyltransferase
MVRRREVPTLDSGLLEVEANMDATREVVVVSAVRTPVGGFGGTLKDIAPTRLGAMVVREVVARAGVAPGDVGHAVFGQAVLTEPKDAYTARISAVEGGLPVEVPAVTVNRLCGSGLQAIVSAAQLIQLGDVDCAVAGGTESMSRGAYVSTGHRWGARMGHDRFLDVTVGGLTDPFDDCHMGVTAENVATRWGISREEQDALAVESHRRAARATTEGYFKTQMLPVEIKTKKGTTVFEHDEHVRPDASLETMARLRPVFLEGGTVTAGNASGMNDAAAAVVLVERGVAERQGLTPMARLVGYGFAGVEPAIMGIGPTPAVRKLFERTGLTVDDMDTIELNEAFAAQALAVIRDLELPMEKTNPNGSGISIGHPVAATGAMITVKALYELARIEGRYALVTMCIGGGQGIAAIFERL